MKANEYHSICLSSAQKELVDRVLKEAGASHSTEMACQSVRTSFAKNAVVLFDNENAQRINLGLEPDWQNVDLEWEVAFELCRKSVSWIQKALFWPLGLMGLDRAMVSYMFGIDLPSSMSKESERAVAEAIWIASILQAST